MAYEAKTQNDLAKWWVIGTGSVVNRLSEIMDDCPNGPAIYYTTGWTAAGLEYYRTQATANDSCQEKIGAGAWAALVLGAGIGALNAGEYFYDGATTRLYVRLTGDAAPNATNQVRAHYLWDGSGAGPAIMTEVVEDGCYIIYLLCWIGDGTTTTTLTSLRESVYFADCYPQVKAAATLTLGTLVGNYGVGGGNWIIKYSAAANFAIVNGSSASIKIYGSMVSFTDNSEVDFYYGSVDIRNSILSHSWTSGFDNRTIKFSSYLISLNMIDVYVSASRANFFYISGTLENVRIHNSTSAVIFAAAITITGCLITNTTTEVTNHISSGADRTVTFYNPVSPITTKAISYLSDAVIKENYSVTFHIADKDGADLSGATVTWLDSQANTGNANTDVNGDVSFTLTSRQWTGTSETLTDFNTFTFTISKAGYQTLVMENITLSEAIDWHLELQDPRPTVNISDSETSHDQISDSPVILQVHFLTPDESEINQIAEPAYVNAIIIIVADASHNQTATQAISARSDVEIIEFGALDVAYNFITNSIESSFVPRNVTTNFIPRDVWINSISRDRTTAFRTRPNED